MDDDIKSRPRVDRRKPTFPRTPAGIATIAVPLSALFGVLSGISLGLAYYPGYMMGEYEIQLAWGVSVIKPEHVAVLLG